MSLLLTHRPSLPKALLSSCLHMPLSQGQPDLGLNPSSAMLTTESPARVYSLLQQRAGPPQTHGFREMPPFIETPNPLATGPSPRGREGGSCIRTRDASALEGLGNDGRRLVLGLAKGLAELLHAVSVHDDGVPAGDRERSEGKDPVPEDPEGLPGKGLPSPPAQLQSGKELEEPGV